MGMGIYLVALAGVPVCRIWKWRDGSKVELGNASKSSLDLSQFVGDPGDRSLAECLINR